MELNLLMKKQILLADLHMHNTQVYSFFYTWTCVGSSNVQFYIIWK